MNILGSVRNLRAATALAGVLSAGSGCAMHTAQETHLAPQAAHALKADRFTPNKSHALENYAKIEKLKVLTPKQLKSLWESSNPDEMLQVTWDSILAGGLGCRNGLNKVKDNARRLCEGKKDVPKCIEEASEGVFQACVEPIDSHFQEVKKELEGEALLDSEEAAKTAEK